MTKKLITLACLLLLGASTLSASIIFKSKEDMVADAELIAIVDIQELVSTDRSKGVADLIARG
ncbi:hypothetical protein [Cerasicoccus maritimus]|uniref:hypothetical protein n=1 Tax=Cerasicoccus maritimus TaxID=490089 RepID=UPI002852A52B|nr:hypothetical protein [Cerasicoccus maritimus]